MCYVEKTGWQEKYILPVQLGALAYGELERGLKKTPPMISWSFWLILVYHVPLGRPQHPRPSKRSGECDNDAVQVAFEGKILCCVAKKNYHYVEEMDSSRDCDEKLSVYVLELCGAPTLACHVLCRQRKWELGLL
jgi:hypothetical protein